MVQIISWIVGLALGTVAFLLIRSLIPAIQKSIVATIFVFLLCYGAGITLCQFAWIIGVIAGIVALIVYIFKSKKPLKIDDNDINNIIGNPNTTINENQEKDNEL